MKKAVKFAEYREVSKMGRFKWAGGRLWVYEGDPPKNKPRLDRVPVPASKKSCPDMTPGLEWQISGKDGIWSARVENEFTYGEFAGTSLSEVMERALDILAVKTEQILRNKAGGITNE